MNFKIAAYQGPIDQGNINHNITTVMKVLEQAEKEKVDVLCMPECFLQGYFKSEQETQKNALALDEHVFQNFLEKLSQFKTTTLILGLNEKVKNQLFNTAVVIEKGQLIGKYQKAYTYPPYDYFSLGRHFPVFEKKGVRYSIVICYDIMFREPILLSALQGAQIVFCPMFNRVEKSSPLLPHMSAKNHFMARAFDSDSWLVCSDIIWESKHHTCPGYATIVDNHGTVVLSSKPNETQLLTWTIRSLSTKKKKRVTGNLDLVRLLSEALDPKKSL